MKIKGFNRTNEPDALQKLFISVLVYFSTSQQAVKQRSVSKFQTKIFSAE